MQIHGHVDRKYKPHPADRTGRGRRAWRLLKKQYKHHCNRSLRRWMNRYDVTENEVLPVLSFCRTSASNSWGPHPYDYMCVCNNTAGWDNRNYVKEKTPRSKREFAEKRLV